MTMMERRLKSTRFLRRQDLKAIEDGWLSTNCKRGRVHSGCASCFSLKCSCLCHKRVVPAAR